MKPNDNLIVSSAEPTGINRKKVWMQKGKNWFNKNDLKITNAWQVTYTIDENKDINIKVSQTGGVCFVGTNSTYLKAGTYTFSATTTGQLSEIRVYNAKDNSQILTNSSNSFTLTLEEDAMIYFQFYVFSTSLSNSLKVSEIQIEQGTGKTSYEAYIEPKIYVLNNNGVYEELMKKEDISNELYYKSGDKFITSYGTYYGGTLTGSLKTISFTIPFPKSTKNIKNITINSIKITVRDVKGQYLLNGVTKDTFNGNFTIEKRTDYLYTIYLNSNTAFESINNTPVAVALDSINLTFN